MSSRSEPRIPSELTAVPVEVTISDLGECPTWDWRHGCLIWIDGTGGRIHRAWPRGPAAHEGWHTSSLVLDEPLGAVCLTDGDDLLVALGSGLGIVRDGRVVQRVMVKGIPGRHRLNDGAADAAGRFWVGSIPVPQGVEPGHLLRWRRGEPVEIVRSDVMLANGLAWSLTGDLLYHADSIAGEVRGYPFDECDGSLGSPTTFVRFDPSIGMPDGIAIDDEGCLWVAMWGGWAVRRYDPKGRHVATINLPVENVTSCAFGPQGTLFITTAKAGLRAADARRQPLAGSIFRARVGIGGPVKARARVTDNEGRPDVPTIVHG